jgi:hypothetical protein
MNKKIKLLFLTCILNQHSDLVGLSSREILTGITGIAVGCWTII